MRGLLPVPTAGRMIHVDVFVSTDGKACGPNEEALRADRAGLGYMTNSLGWTLSVAVFDRRAEDAPDPCGDLRAYAPRSQCFRSVVSAVDETELLWLCEKLVPFNPDAGQPDP